MQDTNAKKCSFAVAILLIATVVLRAFELALSLPSVVSLAFYLLIVMSIVIAGLGLKNKTEIPNSFSLKDTSRVGAFSFVAGVGFFANFVFQCFEIYRLIDTGKYKKLVQFLPVCAICVLAILACFYFVCIGTSLCNKAYDFRKLKIFHIAPFLWSLIYALMAMNLTIQPLKDVNSMLKVLAVITLVLFMYFLAGDVQHNELSSVFTMLSAKAFSVFGFMFFVDRMLCVIFKNASALDNDSLFAITIFTISLFAFSYERQAIKNSSYIKGV